MSQLRLYAITPADLASFRGGPGDHARLRALAAERFGFGRVLRPGLSGKLGPLSSRPLVPVDADADRPVPADVETLLAGATPAPERRVAAWRVVGCWAAALARARLSLPLDGPPVGELAALLRAGDPLDLAPVPGMQVGFAAPPELARLRRTSAPRSPRATATTARLRRWLGELDDPDDALGLLAVMTSSPSGRG